MRPADPSARVERVLETRNRVLERIASGAPLPTVLTELTLACEEALPGCLASVMLVERSSNTLRCAAAPSLPRVCLEIMRSVEIAPGRGSCAAAAFSGERLVIDDLPSHPNWQEYADILAETGLRSCWTEPILSSKRDVLGTLALYYRDQRVPDEFEVTFMRTSAHVAGVAIDRARVDDELERHRLTLETEVQRRTAELEQSNRELWQALLDVKTLRGLLPICSACKRVKNDQGYWAQIESYLAEHSEAVVLQGACRECAGNLYRRAPTR
jgi:GAF domain-containing protein